MSERAHGDNAATSATGMAALHRTLAEMNDIDDVKTVRNPAYASIATRL
ncbi:MAG: hypothetical protein H7240_10895 [Glaciimonas sp.]|nr:hypothetical protein [Glaciimonas sp.]